MNTDVAYFGTVNAPQCGDEPNVFVRRGDDEPQPLRHFKQHSSELAWGYGGSGPADLARCILADFLALQPIKGNYGEIIPEIDRIYQDFKFAVVARFPQDASWELHGDDIYAWLQEHPPDVVCEKHREALTKDGYCYGFDTCETCDGSGETIAGACQTCQGAGGFDCKLHPSTIE